MKFCLKVSPAVFSSCSGTPGHSYSEASKTCLCAQLTPESTTRMPSALHLM